MNYTYLYLALLIFAMNIVPAFAPPTWSVLVLFQISYDLQPVWIIAIGAVAAGSGRYCLARLTRLLQNKVSPRQRENLQSAAQLIAQHKGNEFLALGLFALLIGVYLLTKINRSRFLKK